MKFNFPNPFVKDPETQQNNDALKLYLDSLPEAEDGTDAQGYAVKVQRRSEQTINAGNSDALVFDTLIYDSTTDTMWDNGTGNELIAPVDGLYFFEGGLDFKSALLAEGDTLEFFVENDSASNVTTMGSAGTLQNINDGAVFAMARVG
jgi:hypothetical protein